jgi:hypothetical protein
MNDPSLNVPLDMISGHFKQQDDFDEKTLKTMFSCNSACVGSYTHVFVDAEKGNKPVAQLPEQLRKNLERILVA